MAQAVRTEAGTTGDGVEYLVHRRSGLPLIEPSTSTPQQQCGTGSIRGQFGSAADQPVLDRMRCRRTVRCRAFLVALAEHTDQATLGVHVVDVESAQLPHAHPGRVQQLDDEPVPQRDGVELGGTRFGRGQRVLCLAVAKNTGQRTVAGRTGQAFRRCHRHRSHPFEPLPERPRRRGSSRHRCSGRSGGRVRRQPRAHRAEVEVGDGRIRRGLSEVREQ